PDHVDTVLKENPDADLLVHPECGCSTSSMYLKSEGILPEDKTHILSTGKMLKHSNTSEADEFIVATEVGIMHQMQKQNPNKKFMAANQQAVCPFMKMINLENVLAALKENKHIITVPDETARKAKLAIDRMVAVGRNRFYIFNMDVYICIYIF